MTVLSNIIIQYKASRQSKTKVFVINLFFRERGEDGDFKQNYLYVSMRTDMCHVKKMFKGGEKKV